MRISDWSSDVCSSDLRRSDREGGRRDRRGWNRSAGDCTVNFPKRAVSLSYCWADDKCPLQASWGELFSPGKRVVSARARYGIGVSPLRSGAGVTSIGKGGKLREIGRAHVYTPGPTDTIVCRLLLEI